MQTFHIIRSAKTGRLIEAHDALSLEYGQQQVETHNKLYPTDPWVMVEEVL